MARIPDISGFFMDGGLGRMGERIGSSRVGKRGIAMAGAAARHPRRVALGGGIAAGGAVGAGIYSHRSSARDGLQGRSSGGFNF